MKSDTELRQNIMRRVWGVYILRQATSPALRLGVLLASAGILATSVSVTNVLANALNTSGLTGFARFVLVALQDTTLPVQALTVLAAALVLWFVVDTVQNFMFARSMKLANADLN